MSDFIYEYSSVLTIAVLLMCEKQLKMLFTFLVRKGFFLMWKEYTDYRKR